MWVKCSRSRLSEMNSPKLGDLLIKRGGVQSGTVRWIQGEKIGLMSKMYGLDSHMVIRIADLESGRWALAANAVTQTGDNVTDDGEGEAPSAMGADPASEEDAATGFTRERDRLRPKIKKNEPLTDPGQQGPPHSEQGERYTQPPRDSA